MPTIFESMPEDVYTAYGAAIAVGINPGDSVFLQGSLGDCGPNGSVSIPAGHRGIVKRFFWRCVNSNSPYGHWYMEVDMLDSLGQPLINSILRDARSFWSLTPPPPPPPPPPSSSLEYLLSDEYDNL